MIRREQRRWSGLKYSARVYACLAILLSTTGGEELALQVSEQELRNSANYKLEPEYPAVARQIRLTGDVDLEVVVDATGSVEKVTVLRGNTLLVGSSTQAIKKWKFNPFRTSGQPVRAMGPIRFSFQM